MVSLLYPQALVKYIVNICNRVAIIDEPFPSEKIFALGKVQKICLFSRFMYLCGKIYLLNFRKLRGVKGVKGVKDVSLFP